MGKEAKHLIHTVGVEAGLGAPSLGAKLIRASKMATYPGTNLLRPQPLKWGLMRSLARAGKPLHFGVRGVPLIGQIVELFTSSETISGKEEKEFLRNAPQRLQVPPRTTPNPPPPSNIGNRSRPVMPETIKFKPDIVHHSRAFRKYGFPMPGRQSDPYPRKILDVRPKLRQDFLRDYYKANPLAANNARTEARRIIGLADKEFGYKFRPSGIDWNQIHQRQNQLSDFYHANPASAARARSEARTIIDWAHKTIR